LKTTFAKKYIIQMQKSDVVESDINNFIWNWPRPEYIHQQLIVTVEIPYVMETD
jgi:hypothetical protein